MNGRVNHILYQLYRHRFLGWSLLRWLVLVLILYAAGAFLRFLPGGLAVGVAILALVIVGGVLFMWARRRLFVRFRSGRRVVPASPAEPGSPVPAHVTGILQVGQRHQLVVHAPGHVEAFRNGEKAISALVRPSRFLGVGALPVQNEGMWYAFVARASTYTVEVGDLLVNGSAWPALRIRVLEEERGKRTLYLAFASDEELAQAYVFFSKDAL